MPPLSSPIITPKSDTIKTKNKAGGGGSDRFCTCRAFSSVTKAKKKIKSGDQIVFIIQLTSTTHKRTTEIVGYALGKLLKNIN